MQNRTIRIVVLAEFALLGVAVVIAAATGGVWGAFVMGGFFAACLALVVLDRTLPPLLYTIIIAVALFDAAGFAWDLYTRPGPYDEIAHFLTSFAASLTVAYLFYDGDRANFPRRGLLFVLTITSVGLAIGVAWEIIEWVFGFIGTLEDTITDLIFDIAGAFLGAVLAARAMRRRDLRDAAATRASRHFTAAA